MEYEQARRLEKGSLVYEVTTPAEGPSRLRAWTVTATTDSRVWLAQPETGKVLCQRKRDMGRFERSARAAALAAVSRVALIVGDAERKLEASRRLLDDRRALLSSLS